MEFFYLGYFKLIVVYFVLKTSKQKKCKLYSYVYGIQKFWLLWHALGEWSLRIYYKNIEFPYGGLGLNTYNYRLAGMLVKINYKLKLHYHL